MDFVVNNCWGVKSQMSENFPKQWIWQWKPALLYRGSLGDVFLPISEFDFAKTCFFFFYTFHLFQLDTRIRSRALQERINCIDLYGNSYSLRNIKYSTIYLSSSKRAEKYGCRSWNVFFFHPVVPILEINESGKSLNKIYH